MAATIRTLIRSGGKRLHLFGVESYASARGGDELFALLNGQRPASVLMESFAVPDQVTVGGVIDYRAHLDPRGLEKASAMIVGHDFRAALTCEAVGVLTALRVGAEVRFADRQHTLSFDRLVARLSVEELRHAVIVATEAFAASLEEGRAKNAGPAAPHLPGRPPQNVLCQFFPELWSERHLVMAQVVQQTLDQSESDVALVVGVEHLEPVVRNLDAGLLGVDRGALLRAPSSSQDRQEELEKRAALGALLVSTQTFPAEYVLQPAEEMDKESLAIVRKVYPKYRWAIDGRLNIKDGKDKSAYDRLAGILQGGQSVRGLTALEELCESLAE